MQLFEHEGKLLSTGIAIPNKIRALYFVDVHKILFMMMSIDHIMTRQDGDFIFVVPGVGPRITLMIVANINGFHVLLDGNKLLLVVL